MTDSLAIRQSEDVAARALSVIDQARAIVVADQAGYEAASEFLGGVIKPTLAQIEATFRPITRAQDAAKKATLAERAKLEEPILDAEKRLKSAMLAHVEEQARQRRAAEQAALRVAEAAQAAAEAERNALAEILAEEGDTETACALLELPVIAPAPIRPPPVEAPHAKGASVRTSWDWRLVDESKIPRKFLCIDEKKIAAVVRAMGPEAAKDIPGIDIFEKTTLAQRVR